MNLHISTRLLALGLLVAVGAFSALPARAADMRTVMFKAYDSKGKDTGKCLRGSDTLTEGLGGYRLASCDPKAKAQLFKFDPGGQGGPIVQFIGESATTDGLPLYLAVLNGAADDVWKVNGPIGRVSGQNANGMFAARGNWRWSGRQIFNTDPQSPNFCLTAASNSDPEIRLGDCRKPATLTQWDVVIVK